MIGAKCFVQYRVFASIRFAPDSQFFSVEAGAFRDCSSFSSSCILSSVPRRGEPRFDRCEALSTLPFDAVTQETKTVLERCSKGVNAAHFFYVPKKFTKTHVDQLFRVNRPRPLMKHIKCVVVGDEGSNKRSLLLTYTTNAFPGEYEPTVFDNYEAIVMTEGQQVKLQLWDTAGQEDYKKLRPLSYPQTDVFVLCFHVASPTQLENVQNCWVPEIKTHCPNTPFILVGTNCELRDQVPADPDEWRSRGMELIPRSKCEEMQRKIGARAYIECSARTRTNLKEVFAEATYVALHAEADRPSPKAGAEGDRRKRPVQVAFLGTEAGRQRIDSFLSLSVRSMTNFEPFMRDKTADFKFPVGRKSVNLLATPLDSPPVEDLAKYDFVVFLVSWADSNVAARLDVALRSLEPSAATKTGWIFVTLDREERTQSAEAVAKLKNWVQRMNGQLLDASLRSGVGLHEVFGHIGKSWLGK